MASFSSAKRVEHPQQPARHRPASPRCHHHPGVRLQRGRRPLDGRVPIAASLGLLEGSILLSSQIRAQVYINWKGLRSGFTDRLRQKLLHQVFEASSAQLDRLGRGELLALLMADINRTALSLDQAVRMGQSLLAVAIFLICVVLVGQAKAWPLLLALLATTAAALLQRSSSWELGRIRSRLNAGLQRTSGGGLQA